MTRKVIDRDQLPSHWPVVGTLVWWLVLERLDAPGWVWGSVGAVVFLAWLAIGYRIFTDKDSAVKFVD